MRRLVTSFMVAAGLLAACGNQASTPPQSSAPPLLTDSSGMIGCYLSYIEGPLVVDPTYGTAIVESIEGLNGLKTLSPTPVMWPKGYQARQSGSEIEVLDQSGRVVARTGTSIHIGGGYQGESPGYWLACGLPDALPYTLPGQ